MLAVLSLIGRHASAVLIVGFFVVALFPDASAVMRPYLPGLVSLVLGLGIARLNVRQVLTEFANPRIMLGLAAIITLFLPLTAATLAGLARAAGFGPDAVLLMVVFGAAPPLSSAASICLLLGYNARIALQAGIIGTLALPILGPLCLGLAGLHSVIDPLPVALRFAAMIAGGFAIGLALQAILGADRIARNAAAFNGVVAIAMLLFLFPLLDGVQAFVLAAPLQSAVLAALAIVLNIGGNLAMARLALLIYPGETANALGFIFGNRNVSFYLAVLPLNPMVSVFVAAAQIPIYGTPLLFSWLQRRAAR